ncbi:hypothetical protein [Haloarcula argentinensis]|uniref:Uncharacterized protein n=1 Tax=Haloarcula argentinensis TaxID=43776 RepID=A0A830FHR7_HALAR|nr:hypothetical protein [Haloarcula argentinensis]MDS0255765.1 hypothetical protein [Haloarcula argentinensis]GGM51308.1 hypothetical protein GCM10009006_35610 [Haloarcula argentinensis]
MPGPKRQAVVDEFNSLSPQTRRYLRDSDVDSPASEAMDLFKRTDSRGRRSLNGLADTDSDAADILLERDDAAT